MSLIIDDSNIHEVITSSKVTILDFFTTWCSPCTKLSPIIDELADDNKDISIGKVNAEENKISSTKYGIRSVPAILFFKDGLLVDKMLGLVTKDTLQAKVDHIKNN